MYQAHKNLRKDSHNNTADEYIANHTKDCDANLITMKVNPSGSSYTVSIPATGHSRTFKTRTNHLR